MPPGEQRHRGVAARAHDILAGESRGACILRPPPFLSLAARQRRPVFSSKEPRRTADPCRGGVGRVREFVSCVVLSMQRVDDDVEL